MFTPGSKRAILRTRILARPGETFTKSEACQLSDAGPSTAKFVLNQMMDAGEVELLTDTFPPGWHVAGKKTGRPSKQAGLRTWLLRHPGETFTSRQARAWYGGDISRITTLDTLASMVKRGELIKHGNTSAARWTVVEKHHRGKPSGVTLRKAAGLPSLEMWVSNL